jgi:hypothetical protein
VLDAGDRVDADVRGQSVDVEVVAEGVGVIERGRLVPVLVGPVDVEELGQVLLARQRRMPSVCPVSGSVITGKVCGDSGSCEW